jgi:hypothetical protein
LLLLCAVSSRVNNFQDIKYLYLSIKKAIFLFPVHAFTFFYSHFFITQQKKDYKGLLIEANDSIEVCLFTRLISCTESKRIERKEEREKNVLIEHCLDVLLDFDFEKRSDWLGGVDAIAGKIEYEGEIFEKKLMRF